MGDNSLQSQAYTKTPMNLLTFKQSRREDHYVCSTWLNQDKWKLETFKNKFCRIVSVRIAPICHFLSSLNVYACYNTCYLTHSDCFVHMIFGASGTIFFNIVASVKTKYRLTITNYQKSNINFITFMKGIAGGKW